MTYCKEFSALLDPYIDGELSPEETARVREHLHTCDGCRAYVQAALAIRDAFPEAEDTPGTGRAGPSWPRPPGIGHR